ncbi:hypothetical protein Ddye_016462 [Dipteronia dyeriana]|uniref:DUF1985 domain-containing protein n=1 Tax=Dipteronia dyeriana TaxID=168575 RepID=A0AAD9U7G5_9ROSI|nr:hypothetical protein Ddye_016462 [Dipteronia dyeriana]
MTSCFGHFMSTHREMKFSGGVIHRLLLRELDHTRPTDEMRLLLENHMLWFSKVEFYLITGLRFGVVPDTGLYAAVENGIHQRYFPRGDEVSLEELRVVLSLREFQEAYDAVKLCLIYMLNWMLIGVDERFKILVWQFRLVEDLTAFDAFLWGAHIYRHSILSFKHVLPRRSEERGQQSQGDVVHTVEEYNIYGLSHALLIFAFEVIPDLGVEFGTRRVTELSSRMLWWELTKQPKGKKLAKIFSARTTVGGSYGDGSDEEGGGGRRSDTEAFDPSSPGFSAIDTDRSEPSPRRMLHMRLYSLGTTLLGPSLIKVGLEHLLELCPGCPHLLQFYVVVLSEDEICRPALGWPACLLEIGFKTTLSAMTDGTTQVEGCPTGIIGTEYTSITVCLL